MKILPNIERNKESLKYAMLFCEKKLGNEAYYKLDVLEKLIKQYLEIINLIENCDETKVVRIKMTCGCMKREVECKATEETKLYTELIELKTCLEKVVTILKVNDLEGTKGFDFKNNEINKTAEYLFMQEMKNV